MNGLECGEEQQEGLEAEDGRCRKKNKERLRTGKEREALPSKQQERRVCAGSLLFLAGPSRALGFDDNEKGLGIEIVFHSQATITPVAIYYYQQPKRRRPRRRRRRRCGRRETAVGGPWAREKPISRVSVYRPGFPLKGGVKHRLPGTNDQVSSQSR